jgi:hypothetical protein
VKSQAQIELAGGVPYVSDADLEAAVLVAVLFYAQRIPTAQPG